MSEAFSAVLKDCGNRTRNAFRRCLKTRHKCPFRRETRRASRGGLVLIGSVGAEIGVPFLANDGGAKAYIHSLGEALHYEFKPQGVYVTVVPPPLTDTAVLAKLGFDPRTMPMKPTSVEQCISD